MTCTDSAGMIDDITPEEKSVVTATHTQHRIELMVLALLIERPGEFPRIGHLLKTEIFYYTPHRAIMDAIKDLYNSGHQFDFDSIEVNLTSAGRWVPRYGATLREIDSILESNFNETLDYLVSVLIEQWQLREISRGSSEIMRMISGGTTIDQVCSHAQRYGMFIDAQNKVTSGDTEANMIEVDTLSSPGIMCPLFKTVIFRRKNLYIIAGRPAMGKTTYMLWLAMQIARTGKKVLFFSLEMSKQDMLERISAHVHQRSDMNELLAAETMENDKRRVAGMPPLEGEYTRVMNETKKEPWLANIVLDDTALDISEILAVCSRRITSSGADIVFVDYLQLSSDQSQRAQASKVEQVTGISLKFKRIAMKMDLPVVCGSQLNRSVEMREEKRPLLSDLRESGAIEQDATGVLMLYRDEYYNARSRDPGALEIIVAKMRFSKVGVKKFLLDAGTVSLSLYDPAKVQATANSNQQVSAKKAADVLASVTKQQYQQQHHHQQQQQQQQQGSMHAPPSFSRDQATGSISGPQITRTKSGG